MEVVEASAQLFELSGGGEGVPVGLGFLGGEVVALLGLFQGPAGLADRCSQAATSDEAGLVVLAFEAGEIAAGVDEVAPGGAESVFVRLGGVQHHGSRWDTFWPFTGAVAHWVGMEHDAVAA